jgi:hypothetical protein
MHPAASYPTAIVAEASGGIGSAKNIGSVVLGQLFQLKEHVWKPCVTLAGSICPRRTGHHQPSRAGRLPPLLVAVWRASLPVGSQWQPNLPLWFRVAR